MIKLVLVKKDLPLNYHCHIYSSTGHSNNRCHFHTVMPFDGDFHFPYCNNVVSLGHVIMVVFAVNWTMYSFANRYVSVVAVAFPPMAYDDHRPYRMHNLYLLNNLSMLNLVLIYPVGKETTKHNANATILVFNACVFELNNKMCKFKMKLVVEIKCLCLYRLQTI